MATLAPKNKVAASRSPKVIKAVAQKSGTTTSKPASTSVKPVATKTITTSVAKVDKKKTKPEKVKVVRDSYTIPKAEYVQIAALKKRALDLGSEVKKSELLRAGLLLLVSASDAGFRKAISQVPTLKTGRPGKA